jgi:trimeric autotransporter adhesin
MNTHRRSLKNSLLFLALIVSVALTACGGGGGSEPSSSTPPVPVTVDLTPIVTGMSPSIAAVGAKITVTGNNLSKVTAVRIGNLTVVPSKVSDTSLEFIVPNGAASAKIEIVSPVGSSLSSVTLVVIGVPNVTSVSPSTVLAGRTVTLAGINLDQISSVLLNGVELSIASGRNSRSLVISVPATASSGALIIVATDGVSRISTVQITVNTPLVLSSFSPASGLIGTNVTLNGTGFLSLTSVNFTGASTAASITTRSSGSITVLVPTGATTGPITLNSASETITSSTSFTVIPRISVSATAVYNAATAGSPVTMTGTGLDQVSSVTVASANASITSRTATQLVFSAPNGLQCGAITLSSLNQPSVSAGSLVVGSGCVTSDISIASIEFAQVHSLNAGATYQRLSPGKETWVRAYVTSTNASRAAPTVRLTALAGSTILGSLTMVGPTPLPQLATNATPPDAMLYNITQTFRVRLPDAWVASALKVRVDVDPGNPAGALATREATPVVGDPIALEVVLVPLVSGTDAPVMPTTTTVEDALARAFPLPRDRVRVTVRAPLQLAQPFIGPDGVFVERSWNKAVLELFYLRGVEVGSTNNKKIYYGFAKPYQPFGVGGVAAGLYAAVGKDATHSSWERIMVHEVGHTMGIPHAPCGGADGQDPSYPYAGGVMGKAPLFNSLTDLIANPSTGNAVWDVMSYCGGYWFSDYNIAKMQPFMEQRTREAPPLALMEKSASSETSLIMISGIIEANRASITYVFPAQGAPQVISPTGYELELTTASGQVMRTPLQLHPIDHFPAMLFSASVASPGQLSAIRILHNGQVIGEKLGTSLLKAEKSTSSVEVSVPWARVKESGRLATFEWNAAYGTAAITHLVDGQRTVLKLSASGGKAELDISHLPRGGVFEIGLSDGLNVHSLTLTR